MIYKKEKHIELLKRSQDLKNQRKNLFRENPEAYSQIWIIQKNQQIFIGGNTNRAVFEFELEFLKFIK